MYTRDQLIEYVRGLTKANVECERMRADIAKWRNEIEFFMTRLVEHESEIRERFDGNNQLMQKTIALLYDRRDLLRIYEPGECDSDLEALAETFDSAGGAIRDAAFANNPGFAMSLAAQAMKLGGLMLKKLAFTPEPESAPSVSPAG